MASSSAGEEILTSIVCKSKVTKEEGWTVTRDMRAQLGREHHHQLPVSTGTDVGLKSSTKLALISEITRQGADKREQGRVQG